MKILIRRSKPKSTEHGLEYSDEPTYLSFCKQFKKTRIDNGCACNGVVSENKCHLTTVPLKKYIHPSLKNKIPCYTGDYFEEKVNNKVTLSCNECPKC
jgi:hypothetical protein